MIPPSPLPPSAPGLRALLAILVFLGGDPCSRAHLFLYEHMQVHLGQAGEARVEFLIHAPELPAAAAMGIDPAAPGDAWLRGLDDEAIGRLTAEAEAFVRATFQLRWGGGDPLAGAVIRFPRPHEIRDPPPEELLAPGCLPGEIVLPLPAEGSRLELRYSPDAAKRLMISVARPRAFPEIHDLAPGDSAIIPLAPADSPE